MLVIIQVTINGCLDNGVKEIKEENNVDKIKQINIDFYKKEKYRYIDINIAFGKHKESIVFKSIFDIIGFNIDRQDEAFFTINCENAEYVGSLIFTEQDLNDIDYKDKNIINLDLYRDKESKFYFVEISINDFILNIKVNQDNMQLETVDDNEHLVFIDEDYRIYR